MPATKPQLHDRASIDQQDSAETPEFGHPRGTLAIVAIFGALFLLGWLAMYMGLFLKRGAPH